MTGISADLRRSFRDLEDDLERAHANFERAIGREFISGDEEGVIADPLDELAWETSQALKTFKQQVLIAEAAS
jgi:hypothetical protein